MEEVGAHSLLGICQPLVCFLDSTLFEHPEVLGLVANTLLYRERDQISKDVDRINLALSKLSRLTTESLDIAKFGSVQCCSICRVSSLTCVSSVVPIFYTLFLLSFFYRE